MLHQVDDGGGFFQDALFLHEASSDVAGYSGSGSEDHQQDLELGNVVNVGERGKGGVGNKYDIFVVKTIDIEPFCDYISARASPEGSLLWAKRNPLQNPGSQC